MWSILKYENLRLIKRKIYICFLLILLVINCYFFSKQYSGRVYDSRKFLDENTQYIENYRKLQDSIEERSEAMLSVSIFNKGDFTSKNIIKSVEDFIKIKNIRPDKNVTAAADSAGHYKTINIILAVAILLTAYFLTAAEDIRCGQKVVCSTIYGNKINRLSGIITLIIASIIITVFFSGVIWIMSFVKYGVGNIHAPIQSIKAFSSCVFRINIVQFMVLSIIVRCLGSVLMALIFYMIFSLFDNVVAAGCINVVYLIVEYFAYTFIVSSSRFSFIKYCNIFSLTDSGPFFSEYRNFNILGNPVSRINVYAVTYLILLLIILFTIHICGTYKKRIRINIGIDRIIRKIRKVISGLINGKCLLVHELYRLLISNGCILFIIMAVFVGADNLNEYDTNIYNSKEAGYKSAMYRLEGIWDDEKKEEYEGINRLASDSGSIYAYAIDEITLDVNRCEELKDTVNNIGIINWYFTRQFFNDKKTDITLMFVFLFLTIPVMSMLFMPDSKRDVRKFIKIMPGGGNRLFFSRMVLGIFICLFVQIMVYGSHFYNIFTGMKNIHTEVAIQSVDIFSKVSYSMTVREYIIFSMIITCIGNICASVLIMMFTIYMKDFLSGMVMSFAVFVVPVMIVKMGINLDYFCFNAVGLIRGNGADGLKTELIAVGAFIIASITACIIGRHKYVRGY